MHLLILSGDIGLDNDDIGRNNKINKNGIVSFITSMGLFEPIPLVKPINKVIQIANNGANE